MHFDSVTFLIAFAGLLTLRRFIPVEGRAHQALLLAVSYGFYLTWSPLYLPFLVGSTVLDYFIGLWMGRSRRQAQRRALLASSVLVNLGLLVWFKYAHFLLEVIGFGPVGTASGSPAARIFVPLGISFFTFQTLSYSIDVYRREIRPTKSLLEFALFVSFFPQLVAGPIVRAGELMPQLARRATPSPTMLGYASGLMVLGLFQKVVLADGLLRPVAEQVFEAPWGSATLVDVWLGVYAFWGQLYCDFAGYSNIAIGMAGALGIALPPNFKSPFAAARFSEFWRRWHMTLTRWFGAYLYVPLGGNRKGVSRTMVNVLVVMSVAGLWHGAAWTFLLWGLVHALFLIAERGWNRERRDIDEHWLRALTVCAAVGASCLLFRAHDLGQAWALGSVAVGLGSPGISPLSSSLDLLVVVGVLAFLFAVQWRFRNTDLPAWFDRQPAVLMAAGLAVLLFLVVSVGGESTRYVYFQF